MPKDEGENREKVPAEELIPDAASAIRELIGPNDLLEEAGVEFTAVSSCEIPQEEFRPQEICETELQEAAIVGDQAQGNREVNLDEFETGMYLCRWPNGDFSLVAANTRREALVELDEWDAAHPSQLFPLESCMVDFKLNDQGEIELKQFGEDTEKFIWETCYPELHSLLASVVPEDSSECTAEPWGPLPTITYKKWLLGSCNQRMTKAESQTSIFWTSALARGGIIPLSLSSLFTRSAISYTAPVRCGHLSAHPTA